jgi:hypothetical protein
MANHPEPREHDVGQDQNEDDLQSPISSAATSAAVAAPAASTPITPVSAVPAVSAVSTSTANAAAASAAVHHDEIARASRRRRAGGTYEFAESSHGRIQTARTRAS